jgi:hypothetical protein
MALPAAMPIDSSKTHAGKLHCEAGVTIINGLSNRWSRFRPIDQQLPFREEPPTFDFAKCIEIADRCNQQRASPFNHGQMVGEAIAFAGRMIPVKCYGTLSIEMCRYRVRIQVGENGRQLRPTAKLLRWCGRSYVHEHDKMGIHGKESHLPLGIASVCAMCIGVDQLPDCEPVACFRR